MLFAGMIFASILVVALHLAGYDAVAAVRDQSLSEGPEAGLLSNLGILLMGFSAATAGFGAWKASSLPLAFLSVFCCLFTIDDAFLIHERLGFWEFLAFALYGLLAFIVLFLFWKTADFFPWPVLVAFGAFAVSVAIDVVWGDLVIFILPPSQTQYFLWRAGFIFEDLPKFGGILVLASFAMGESLLNPAFEKER